MGQKKLLIIDSNAVIHRAYYALPKLTTKSGKVVNAVYGFLLILFRAIKDFQPDFVVATFDYPAPTFRTKIYEAYKAQRPKAPDELYQQIPEVKAVLRALGIKILEKEGYEADDLIGTIISRTKESNIEKIILTGDLDILQLIDASTKVLLLKKGIKNAVLYDKKKFKEKYGFEPGQLVDFKALKGDPSDNIPGVVGIGQKTAIFLIQKFGSLENLYKEIEKTKEKISPKLKEDLKKYKKEAVFSKQLIQIKKDVPIEFEIGECKVKTDNFQKAKEKFEELEFFSLIKRLSEIFPKKERPKQQKLI